MSLTLRILLIVAAVITAAWILWKIRKHKVKMEHAIFWIVFALVLVVIGIVPQLASWLGHLLGVMSTANLVFLVMIFLLIAKVFTLSITVSQLQDKIEVLSGEVALEKHVAGREKKAE